MNRPASLSSLAIVCLALTDPALAAGPVPLKPGEMVTIDPIIEQVEPPNDAGDTARILSAGEERARATQASMQAFAKRSAILIDNPAPAAAAAAEPPAGSDKQGGVTVQSDGGMYFDAGKNVIVYTKNIRLDEARFKLDCDDQLQVFLKSEPKKPGVAATGGGDEPEAKPDESKKPDSKEEGGLLGMGGTGISGVERIIATGNVKVTSKDKQGNVIVASAESAIYESATGSFILKGGMPQIQHGPSYQRALEPGIYIRYNSQDGNFEMSEGKKETFFVLPDKKSEKNK
jgi:lipopolysaccharide export system protein LptA